MTRLLLISLVAAGTLIGAGWAPGAVSPAFAVAPPGCGFGENCSAIELAQASCAAVAARVAQQMGGQVIGAPREIERGGRIYCVVTILVQDPQGQRPPQRQQVEVPM